MSDIDNSVKNNIFSNENLHKIFVNINRLQSEFLKEVQIFFKIGGENGHMYTMDFFTSAIINRSISLMKGFVSLSKENNYISSVPLIRLQVDNCMRFYASTLVNDYNNFYVEYLKGEHIRNIKDAKGKKMTDTYLIQKLDEVFPGIHKLYVNSSSHIHLSNEHAFLQTSSINIKERTIETQVGNFDFYPIDKKVDFAYNMLQASKILLELTRSWTHHKREIYTNK